MTALIWCGWGVVCACAGGTTRIPKLRQTIHEWFAADTATPPALAASLDPELVVVIGATIRAANLTAQWKVTGDTGGAEQSAAPGTVSTSAEAAAN